MGLVPALSVNDRESSRASTGLPPGKAALAAFGPVPRWLQARLGVKTGIAIFGLTLIAMVVYGVTASLQGERERTIDNAIRQNSNLALAFEEHAIRTLKGVDAVTLFLKHDFERRGAKIDIAKYLDHNVVDGKLATALSVIDEHGRLVVSTHALMPIKVTDREHFMVHRQRDSGQLYISKPVVARTSGKWSIYMTRRINKADGSFGGIVAMTVDLGASFDLAHAR